MSSIRSRSVPSGSYVVSAANRGRLEAHLGTCVGVTLCDRDSGVGGLIHLLLPEPTGIDRSWRPECYASTGLPLFVQALHDLGASTSRLEACVAGGGLVGPMETGDVGFDLGGRTLEAVERALDREGIPICQSETGGCLGYSMSLDLFTWGTEIRPIGFQPESALPNSEKRPSRPSEQSIASVRPIPQVALKILRMIREQKLNLLDVAHEIREDQILSARVIRLCNSSLFGLRGHVDSIDRALVLLGERRLLQLVVSASLEGFYPEHEQGYSLCKGGLYRHALGTAMVTQELAQFTGRALTDVAYTAGLLHDIGKVVLDQYVAATYPLFYRRTQVDGVDLVDVERDTFGVAHTRIGGRLAEQWSLPPDLTDAIRFHHRPEEASVAPELTHLVYLADLLMSRFLAGQLLERSNTRRFAIRLKRIGLTPSQLPILVDLIPRGVFDTVVPG